MKKQKRLCFACLLALMLLMSIGAGAQEPAAAYEEPAAAYEELEQSLLGNDFFQSLPKDVQDNLERHAIQPKKSALEDYLSFEKLLSFLTAGVSTAVRNTLQSFAAILSITLIFAILSTMRTALQSTFLTYAFSMAATVTIAVTLFSSIQAGYQSAVAAVEDMTMITKASLPVMATAMVSSGAPASAAALTGAMLLGADFIAGLNQTVLLPVLNIYLGLSIASSISTNMKLTGITKFLKSIMIWGMCLCATLFTSVLSFQKIITATSDTVATQSAKFAFSSAIPIVGSSLEGALNTVFSCVSMIKNTVGIFAVIAVFVTILPSVLNAAAYMLMLSLSAEISQIAGEDNISQLLKSLSGVWSILLAVLTTQSITVILSLALLLNIVVPS